VESKKRVIGKNISAVLKAATVAIFGTILHQSSLFDQLPFGSFLSLSLVLLVALQIRTASSFKSPNLVFAFVILGLIFYSAKAFGKTRWFRLIKPDLFGPTVPRCWPLQWRCGQGFPPSSGEGIQDLAS